MKRPIIILTLLIGVSSLSFAQTGNKFDGIKIHDKNGDTYSYPLSQISTVEFQKRPYLGWSEWSNIPDTVFMGAGASRGFESYIADANLPISYESNAPWLSVYHEDMYDYYTSLSDCYSHSQNTYSIAVCNDSDKDRYGTVTLSIDGGKSLSYTVRQKGYDLKFFEDFLTWDGPTELSADLLAYDTLAVAITTVNFGMTVTEKPEWVHVKDITDYKDRTLETMMSNKLMDTNSGIGFVSIGLQPNPNLEERKGDVIISGGGQSITWHLTQAGVIESIATEAGDLYKSLTASSYLSTNRPDDMGFPGYMVATGELLGDMYPSDNFYYDWFKNFGCNESYFYYNAYIPWFTLYGYIDKANDLITKASAIESISPAVAKAIKSVSQLIRSYCYYTLMTLYEPKENIYTDCSAVAGLTVPIVTESTTDEQAANNPRATHDEMVKFILSDLSAIEENASYLVQYLSQYPDISGIIVGNIEAIIHGMRARVYLWDKKYGSAASEARAAIDASSCRPMTQEQWLDVQTGFNTANQAWLLGISYTPENTWNLINFTSWMNAEADWGYSNLTRPAIDRSLYDRISDTDFRKYAFIDPLATDYPYWSYQSPRGEYWLSTEGAPYLALKFRCKNGDYINYEVGAMVDLPLMRIEEMYLIEAEGIGKSTGLDAGIGKLEAFMQQYRDSSYQCQATSVRDFQLECMWQKRIEFWGEGVAFPDAKRLEAGVMQYYEGSNVPNNDDWYINAQGIKPNWNFVIPEMAIEANSALINNPSPSGSIPGNEVEIGQYYIP